jgi:hypothetical protein
MVSGRALWARLRYGLVAAAALVYLLLAGAQLGLPGLHYDEAKEAGVNAVELLTAAPVTAFRDAALTVGPWRLPLMVQDYIGSLYVYLALPFLASTGVGVPNLRGAAVLVGLATLLTATAAVDAWTRRGEETGPRPGIAWDAVLTAWLLAASPSFVFWNRQGVFVTNLMQPFCWLAAWQGVVWLAHGRRRHLALAALAAGLALYAKLLAVWVVGPLALLLAWGWLQRRRRCHAPRLDGAALALAAAAFLTPLTPLMLFNAQTGGTLAALLGNAATSYYGVDNAALWANAAVRLAQVEQSLRGDQFWYLGGLFGNPAAPWLAGAGVVAGLVARPRRMVAPLVLAALAFAASLATISGLFITHYALLHPFWVATASMGWATWGAGGVWWRRLAIGVAVAWVALDLSATLQTHRALAASGGLADHSDASYHLADYLRDHGLAAPIALDWGMDATVRFLSEGAVRPIEIFGYASPQAPDEDFGPRLAPFLANPDNVYLLHAPGQTVFHGRREAFLALAAAQGLAAELETMFAQRDGTPLYEVWRVRVKR